MTEREKMIAGLNYNPLDEELNILRLRAADLCHELGRLWPSDREGHRAIIRELLPQAPLDAIITPPFFCDYGFNISIGRRFYCNMGCVILDGGQVCIGDYVMLGPHVQLYTPIHALEPEARTALEQHTEPVRIGNKVWIAGGSIVCPGVSIGEGSVIGAGSVVTRDIPSGVLAAGNPCRVIRELPAAGRL